MVHSRSKRAQAAFEYLFTYGWALLAAIIAIGALSYFGFISPSNLLPNKCSFGKQMECAESKIAYLDSATTEVYIRFRNNFGKQITITDITVADVNDDPTAFYDRSVPVIISSGNVSQVSFKIDTSAYNQFRKSPGEKLGINVIVQFKRSDPGIINPPEHNLTGYIYNTVTE